MVSCFINIEGGNASGKTTIIERLCSVLQNKNKKVICLKSPTSPFDRMWSDIKDCDLLTKYYFFRAVSQNDSEKIKNLKKTHDFIILNRYLYETEAFDLTLQKLSGYDNLIEKHINYHNLLKPDITFFLDVDDNERMNRIEKRQNDKDVCYWENTEFQKHYNQFYRRIAEREKFTIINTSTNNINECINIILKHIDSCYS